MTRNSSTPTSPEELVDAYITLCVHAGIAAADVICCARLDVHAQGQDHNEAITLLASVDKPASGHLATLLGLKTRSGYSARKSSRADRTRAKRAARGLLDGAARTTRYEQRETRILEPSSLVRLGARYHPAKRRYVTLAVCWYATAGHHPTTYEQHGAALPVPLLLRTVG